MSPQPLSCPSCPLCFRHTGLLALPAVHPACPISGFALAGPPGRDGLFPRHRDKRSFPFFTTSLPEHALTQQGSSLGHFSLLVCVVSGPAVRICLLIVSLGDSALPTAPSQSQSNALAVSRTLSRQMRQNERSVCWWREWRPAGRGLQK